LNRVKAQAVAAHVFERDSMYFQARMIGQLEMSGISHKTVDLQLKKLREVTAAQVQEVARKYLVDDQLTVAYLEPQPVEGRKPAAPPAGLLHAQ
jgi:zinc protease